MSAGYSATDAAAFMSSTFGLSLCQSNQRTKHSDSLQYFDSRHWAFCTISYASCSLVVGRHDQYDEDKFVMFVQFVSMELMNSLIFYHARHSIGLVAASVDEPVPWP